MLLNKRQRNKNFSPNYYDRLLKSNRFDLNIKTLISETGTTVQMKTEIMLHSAINYEFNRN